MAAAARSAASGGAAQQSAFDAALQRVAPRPRRSHDFLRHAQLVEARAAIAARRAASFRRVGIARCPETGGTKVTPPSEALPPKALLGCEDVGPVMTYYADAIEQGGLSPAAAEAAASRRRAGGAATAVAAALERVAGLGSGLGPLMRPSGQLSASDLFCAELDSAGRVVEYPLHTRPADIPPGGEAGGCVELALQKSSLTHGDAAAWAAHTLGISERSVGAVPFAEPWGQTTQRVLVRGSDWAARGGKRALPAAGRRPSAIAQGECSSLLSAPTAWHGGAHPAPAERQRCWALVRGVSTDCDHLAQCMQMWAERGAAANLFPPSAFQLPARTPPSWVVGWHAYSRNHVHLCMSAICNGCPPEQHGNLWGLLARGPQQWRDSPDYAEVCRALGSGSPARDVLGRLAGAGRGDPDWRGAASALCDSHSEWVGARCGDFLRVVWNMLASARLELVGPRPAHGDVVLGASGRPEMYSQMREDRAQGQLSPMGCARDGSAEERGIHDVLLPLGEVLLCGAAPAHDRAPLWPSHSVSTTSAEQLLMSFGLHPSDTARMQPLLPAALRQTRYRPLAFEVDDVEYRVGETGARLRQRPLAQAGTAASKHGVGVAGALEPRLVVTGRRGPGAATWAAAAFSIPVGASPVSCLREALLLGLVSAA